MKCYAIHPIKNDDDANMRQRKHITLDFKESMDDPENGIYFDLDKYALSFFIQKKLHPILSNNSLKENFQNEFEKKFIENYINPGVSNIDQIYNELHENYIRLAMIEQKLLSYQKDSRNTQAFKDAKDKDFLNASPAIRQMSMQIKAKAHLEEGKKITILDKLNVSNIYLDYIRLKHIDSKEKLNSLKVELDNSASPLVIFLKAHRDGRSVQLLKKIGYIATCGISFLIDAYRKKSFAFWKPQSEVCLDKIRNILDLNVSKNRSSSSAS